MVTDLRSSRMLWSVDDSYSPTFWDILALEDGTDRWYQNVSK